MSNSGSSVDIGGTLTDPGIGGSDGTSSNDDSTGAGDAGTDDATAPPPVVEDCPPEPVPLNRCGINYTVVMIPDVTLADLASFVPARPSLTGEPAGVGVVGMPTNLVASASAQQIPGKIFDYDVVVRFTPAGFRFDHGDGTSATSASGGASWTALGQAEFTPTSTSHVYTARGTYSVGVTVLYAAAVNFGGGWRPVAGYVEATTAGYGVRVVEVRTALVDKTCIENPSGPGC